ncbi:MAG: glycoside hydrolase family protein, partial [Chloroflexota bacterium]|nr:glycoside hydrolase family protein [Chloroflexota bacterium]
VEAYHAAYTAIKRADPTAQVAIGGLSQVTPLRLAYLERIWTLYAETYGEPMPVDVWNMHAFVLREERDNWGVGMPPGFTSERQGMLWAVEDHSDLRLVEGQVRLLRRWMAQHGQQQKPLWITEYGILMPESYGFSPEVVQSFMLGSFALFDSLRDSQLGYAADENRLVQRWVWFSTRYDPYPAGNLFNVSGRPKPLLRALSDYLAGGE